MRVSAVLNQKGGVGKTTTAVNLGDGLARIGRSVLLIDMDPQSHLTVSFGLNPYQHPGLDDVLLAGAPLQDRLVNVGSRLSVLPAGPRLREVEALSGGGRERAYLLDKALHGMQGWDYVLIDCPPSAGLLTMNALVVCDDVLSPVVGDFLALQGLSVLIGTLKRAGEVFQKQFPLHIALTRFHPRRRLAREVYSKLMQHYSDKVLPCAIRETTALAECPAVGQSIFDYRPDSHGAMDYAALAQAYENPARYRVNVDLDSGYSSQTASIGQL